MLIIVHIRVVVHYIYDDSHGDVDRKGGLCCVMESSGVVYEDRWFTLVSLPAGLVSWSSNVGTDASHTNNSSRDTTSEILYSIYNS